MNRIFLLEDDPNICELVACALETGGITVTAFHTVAAFYDGLKKVTPDLCLLDVMLPDGNGLDVLKAMTEKQLPCIVLSALGGEIDKVKGLNLGAEDYIAKPFGVLELSARVHAALRRNKKEGAFLYDRGGVTIDAGRAEAALFGQNLDLNPKEFGLLCCLAKNEGKVMSRDKLLTLVWGYDAGETRTVDNHVARLRRLGLGPFIRTVHGLGYKFETP